MKTTDKSFLLGYFPGPAGFFVKALFATLVGEVLEA